jgi:2-polyprenyl-6-methoxyphenol hydroxylase-like FAD-dependent oxidoreductase
MSRRTILIAGASIAGPTLAWWLVRAGFAVTIVESAAALRAGGNGVDIREQALEIIGRMGLAGAVRGKAIRMHGMRFVDAHDRETARLSTAALEQAIGTEDIEIPRGDLSHILHEATMNDVDYIFSDGIAALAQDADGVDVTFRHAPARRFDMVIGADGLHSAVRAQVFGSEAEFVRFRQHYFAVASCDLDLSERGWITFYNEPGRSAAFARPETGGGLLNFLFCSDVALDYHHRDLAQQRHLLRDAFSGLGWHVPAMLDAADAAPDFYFDSLSQVHMADWSRGRVTLVGDAAYCASPASGAGALLAISGAYRLAGELAAEPNPQTAFRRYQTAQQPLVAQKQAQLFTGLTVPRTGLGIVFRNLLVRSSLLKLLAGFQNGRTEPLRDYDFPAGALP